MEIEKCSIRRAIDKYQKTEKGRIAGAKTRKKLSARGYYSNYMKEKRKKAREEGICIQCFRNRVPEELRSDGKKYAMCFECIEKDKVKKQAKKSE